MIEESLNQWLQANIALAGTRVYPRSLPQNPTLPALTYLGVSGIPWHTHQGTSGIETARFQISCWAERYLAAKQLADQVILNLDCFTGDMAGTTIQACFKLNEVDLGDEAIGYHQIAVDFLITYEY